MIEALLISNIVLWIALVALGFTVMALVRQVGVLHERVAPVGALSLDGGPKVGESAPELAVKAFDGSTIALGGSRGDESSTLIMFVSPTCPVCKTLLSTAARIATEEGPRLRLVLASDGEASEHESFVREHGLDPSSYVLSRDLGMRYQVAKLPYAVLIDEGGVLRASGLVNSREHLESLFSAREHSVASIQEYVSRRDLAAGGDSR